MGKPPRNSQKGNVVANAAFFSMTVALRPRNLPKSRIDTRTSPSSWTKETERWLRPRDVQYGVDDQKRKEKKAASSYAI